MSTPRPGRWEPVSSSWVFRSDFLSLRRDRCRLPDGRLSADMYFMALRDFALVVAVTLEGGVLLSREYKHGAGDVIFTLPAGFIEEGEAPEAGARRELAEETGHAADAFEALGAYLVFPGLSGARGHVFLARDVRRVAEPRPDEFEEIEVVTVPLEALRAELAAAAQGRAEAARHLGDVSSTLAVRLALARLDGRE